MMEKKYKILKDDYIDDNLYYDSDNESDCQKKYRLYRIQALRDFGDVKKGDLGGYIQSQKNLSHSGNCWVYDKAIAGDGSKVKNNAKVIGSAILRGGAIASKNAVVKDRAKVGYSAIVTDNAVVAFTDIYGENVIKDNAVLYKGEIWGNLVVSGNAKLSGGFIFFGYKNGEISGNIDLEFSTIRKSFRDKFETNEELLKFINS